MHDITVVFLITLVNRTAGTTPVFTVILYYARDCFKEKYEVQVFMPVG